MYIFVRHFVRVVFSTSLLLTGREMRLFFAYMHLMKLVCWLICFDDFFLLIYYFDENVLSRKNKMFKIYHVQTFRVCYFVPIDNLKKKKNCVSYVKCLLVY